MSFGLSVLSDTNLLNSYLSVPAGLSAQMVLSGYLTQKIHRGASLRACK